MCAHVLSLQHRPECLLALGVERSSRYATPSAANSLTTSCATCGGGRAGGEACREVSEAKQWNCWLKMFDLN